MITTKLILSASLPTYACDSVISQSPTHFYVRRGQRSTWGVIRPGTCCPLVSLGWLVSLLLQSFSQECWRLHSCLQDSFTTEPFPQHLTKKPVTTGQVALTFISSLRPFHQAYFSFIHQKQDSWEFDWALRGSSHLSQLPPGVGKPLLSSEGLLSQLLFSVYHGPRQLSFVLCLNTE